MHACSLTTSRSASTRVALLDAEKAALEHKAALDEAFGVAWCTGLPANFLQVISHHLVPPSSATASRHRLAPPSCVTVSRHRLASPPRAAASRHRLASPPRATASRRRLVHRVHAPRPCTTPMHHALRPHAPPPCPFHTHRPRPRFSLTL